MDDDERRQYLAILSGLISLGAVLVAGIIQSNPDAPRDLWYRWRLWQAYHDRAPNFDRLRYLRRQRDAGVFDDDMTGESNGTIH